MSQIPNNCTAVVLREMDGTNNFYKIVKIQNFYRDSIVFNTSGCVVEFKVNDPEDETNHDKTFVLLDRDDLTKANKYSKQNNLIRAYYEKETFLDYHEESHDEIVNVFMDDLIKTRYTKFIDATNDDIIFLESVVIEKDNNGQYTSIPARTYLKQRKYKVNYDGETLLEKNEFGVPDILSLNPSTIETSESLYNDYDTDVIFYQNNIHQADRMSLTESERYYIAEAIIFSAISIRNIKNNVLPLLPQNDPLVSDLISQQISYWETPLVGNTGGIFEGSLPDKIVRYHSNVSSFYNLAIADQRIIEDEAGIRSIWRLLACLDSSAMAALSIELRLDFLWIIAKLKKLDDTFLTWEPISFEGIVQNIVWSVNISDANIFLDALLKKPDASSDTTIFQYLFDETNDIGFSPNALNEILSHMCLLWLHSKYSYYKNGIPQSTLTDSSSIAEVFQFMNQDTTVYEEDNVTEEKYSNTPATLDYKSERFLWLFSDTSHDFVMRDEYIVVFKDAEWYSPNPYDIDQTKVYHMYQGVSVALHDNESSNELKLMFQQFAIDGQPTAIVPIFYLAYIDYNKTVKNYTTAIQVAADIALTVTGIGNLLKLRHLFKLTGLGRMALTGETIGETIFVQLAKTTIEIAPSVAQYYVEFQLNGYGTYCDINSPNYDAGKCAWYGEFSTFLMLVQIKAGVIEGTHQLMIRRAAKKLVNDVDNVPEGFNQLAWDALQMFAYRLEDLEDSWKEALYQAFGTYDSNVWQKYVALSTDERKIEFILDFANASEETLSTLNKNGGDLINYWDEIIHLTSHTYKIEFLEAYKRIKTAERLNIEVFEGQIVILDASQPNQFSYKINGIHHGSSFAPTNIIPPIPPRLAKLVGSKSKIKSIIDANGEIYYYYESKVSFYNSTYKNQFPNSDGFKVKTKKSTFFPDEWSKQRLLEEMALAYSRRKYIKDNLFLGKMSDGVDCAFRIEVLGFFENGTPIEGIMETAYPNY
jgi:hypothetical protein